MQLGIIKKAEETHFLLVMCLQQFMELYGMLMLPILLTGILNLCGQVS